MATNSSATASLASAMSRLVLDTDLADLTVTCGEKEWKVHSVVMAVRSPFFKAAITNNMVEKREMKVDIRDFDAETMDGVIDFMYGKRIEKGTIKFLFEAAERFQMDDLKEDVVELARKDMTVENVIELGHLAEMYSIDGFLRECATFIVENNVDMEVDDVSPKLTVMVINIYKCVKQKLKSEQTRSLYYQQKWQACEKDLRDSYGCEICGLKIGSKANQISHRQGQKHAKRYAKLCSL